MASQPRRVAYAYDSHLEPILIQTRFGNRLRADHFRADRLGRNTVPEKTRFLAILSQVLPLADIWPRHI